MSLTPEKLKAMFEDLGKPTMRGVRKCPKCGTLNGTRGISCKNKNCDVVFKEKEKRRGHSADAVKVITGSTVQVFSVRLRDRGPDYRGFVQLPLVQDLDGNPAENVDPALLSSAARCYVETCSRNSHMTMQPEVCPHVRSAITCGEEALPLTLKNSVLNALQVSSEIKQSIWLLATETTGPLVQRVTKNIMVVKCKPNPKHPLGFLHFSFFETARNRAIAEHKFQCSCKSFKTASPGQPDVNRRCVHFYACICAFASDERLTQEFEYYINLDINGFTVLKFISGTDQALITVEGTGDPGTEEAVTTIASVIQDVIEPIEPEPSSIEVIIDDNQSLLSTLEPAASKRRRTSTDDETYIGNMTEAQASSALLTLQEGATITTDYDITTATISSITTESIAAPVTKVTTTTPKKPLPPKHTPAKSIATPNKKAAGVDEGDTQFTFHEWLASVTERVNQTMHYQFDGSPEPLVFHAPQKFFDCLQQRISAGNKKKRLPNSTTGFVRKDALPLGTFTKYTWHITNILHVKQIFDTPQHPLEITRSFVENRDGTFDIYDAPRMPLDNVGTTALGQKQTPIRPFELKTYLKVGNTSPDQKEPTPFIIEWIPDILPKLRIGELRIKFEYGHQRNGHIEQRIQASVGAMEIPSVQMD